MPRSAELASHAAETGLTIHASGYHAQSSFMNRHRWWSVAGAALAIGVATLGSARTGAPQPMFCLTCGELWVVDVALNLLLFVPMGAALVWAGVSWRRAALACALLSLGVEFLQLRVIPGRDASFSDLLANSLGGLGGALIAHGWRRILMPGWRIALSLSFMSTALALCVMAGTAALLHPAIPPMGLWGQLAPQQLQFEPYNGVVHHFRVNGFVVPYSLVPESESLRQSLLTGESLGRVEITSGDPSHRLSAIARLGSRFQEVFMFGAEGNDLVLRTRLAVRDWYMRVPFIALSDALPSAGERAVLEGGVTRRGWFAIVRTEMGVRQREVAFSVALGWTFLLPFDHPLRGPDRWLSTLWLAVLAAPGAWWGVLASRGWHHPRTGGAWWAIASVMALCVGLLVIPYSAQFVPAAGNEWLGILAGGTVGAWLALASTRRVNPEVLHREVA